MIERYFGFVFVFVLLIVVWWIIQPISKCIENFQLPLTSNMPLGSIVHVSLDENKNKIRYSFKPPSAHGIHGCTQVPCPEFIDTYGNYICWSCCCYH